MTLTRREEECLGFITRFISEHGRAPYKYEIAEHIGASSRGFVYRIISSLEAKGRLRNRKYAVSGIELIEPSVAFDFLGEPESGRSALDKKLAGVPA